MSRPLTLLFARQERRPHQFLRRWTGAAIADYAAGDTYIQRRLEEAQALLDDRSAKTRDICAQALWDLEIKGRQGSDYFAIETRRRGAAALGAELGRIWKGDAELLAAAEGYSVEARPRKALHELARGRRVIGLVLLESRRIVVADDLDARESREVVAHELAHALLESTCDGSTAGESAASAFAEEFVAGARSFLGARG